MTSTVMVIEREQQVASVGRRVGEMMLAYSNPHRYSDAIRYAEDTNAGEGFAVATYDATGEIISHGAGQQPDGTWDFLGTIPEVYITLDSVEFAAMLIAALHYAAPVRD